jgi:DNA-binding CsgD family transcriptional regulator
VEIFSNYIQEQPLFEAYIIKRRMETLQITDLMPARDFQRTIIYNEFYRRVGVSNQLVTPMSISDDFFLTCSINTIREDFSERDKLILTLIAPHFANAIRNSFAYQRLSLALETKACGVIAINSKGKPIFISEYGRRLLERYFTGEKRKTNSLPDGLVRWIKQIESTAKSSDFKMPLAPLKIESQKGMLTIRFMYNSTTREKTLMLEEKKLLSPKAFEKFNLTKRETEILFWITQGKADDIIATICNISLRTVHKHIQNIYTKLGVETRTSAMLRAIEGL